MKASSKNCVPEIEIYKALGVAAYPDDLEFQ